MLYMQPIKAIMEETEDTNEPLTKPKKPRTQKQLDAFKIAMEKRASNVASRKHDKHIVASEILVKNAKLAPIVPPATPNAKPKQIVKTESDSSSEEDIIIVKAKPK